MLQDFSMRLIIALYVSDLMEWLVQLMCILSSIFVQTGDPERQQKKGEGKVFNM